MLPEIHRQRYLEFRRSLQQLKATVTQSQPEGAVLKVAWQDLQQFFQNQIIPLGAEELADPSLEQRVQSYQTEMSKQLRLTGTDIMFLQAARQSTTLQQRQVQISDRLTMLVGYCDVLLQSSED